MPEEPKQDSPFDLSDMETTAAETPKAKRKRAGAAAEPLRVVGSGASESHLPGVHEPKPRKRGKVVSSEGKLNASAAGTISPAEKPAKSEVEEALDTVHEMAEESAWDAKIAEAKAGIAAEDAEWEAKIAEAKGKLAAEDAEREAKIAEVRSKIAADEQAARLANAPKIPPSKYGGVMPPPKDAEVPDYEEMTVETAPKGKKMRIPAIPPESEESKRAHAERMAEEQESAWMKQGNDPAELQAIESRNQGEVLYDEGRREVIIDDQETIDAAVGRAEGMLKSGELNMDFFDIRDYEYLLTEQARLDRERETLGYWAARKVLKELGEVKNSLAPYESQIDKVIDARAAARAGTQVLTAKEKEDIAYKGPAPKQELPQGSGTTLHKEGSGTSVHANKKPGFWARLLGKK